MSSGLYPHPQQASINGGQYSPQIPYHLHSQCHSLPRVAAKLQRAAIACQYCRKCKVCMAAQYPLRNRLTRKQIRCFRTLLYPDFSFLLISSALAYLSMMLGRGSRTLTPSSLSPHSRTKTAAISSSARPPRSLAGSVFAVVVPGSQFSYL